jgi:gallate 1-beta-glucosyltransferase
MSHTFWRYAPLAPPYSTSSSQCPSCSVNPELIPVGPLVEVDGSMDEVHGHLIKAADECVGWLDLQAPRSMLYASVDSVVVLSADEVAEMSHGQVAKGWLFLWVVWPMLPLLPEGFLGTVGTV